VKVFPPVEFSSEVDGVFVTKLKSRRKRRVHERNHYYITTRVPKKDRTYKH